MARINRYQQQKLASAAVGTPGLNTAGLQTGNAIEQSLAGEAAVINQNAGLATNIQRQTIAANQDVQTQAYRDAQQTATWQAQNAAAQETQKNKAINDAFTGLGAELRAARTRMAAAAKHEKQMADSSLADAVSVDLSTEMEMDANDFMERNVGSPDGVANKFAEHQKRKLFDQVNQGLKSGKYNKEVATMLIDSGTKMISSNVKQMASWEHGQRVANAKAAVNNSRRNVVEGGGGVKLAYDSTEGSPNFGKLDINATMVNLNKQFDKLRALAPATMRAYGAKEANTLMFKEDKELAENFIYSVLQDDPDGAKAILDSGDTRFSGGEGSLFTSKEVDALKQKIQSRKDAIETDARKARKSEVMKERTGNVKIFTQAYRSGSAKTRNNAIERLNGILTGYENMPDDEDKMTAMKEVSSWIERLKDKNDEEINDAKRAKREAEHYASMEASARRQAKAAEDSAKAAQEAAGKKAKEEYYKTPDAKRGRIEVERIMESLPKAHLITGEDDEREKLEGALNSLMKNQGFFGDKSSDWENKVGHIGNLIDLHEKMRKKKDDEWFGMSGVTRRMMKGTNAEQEEKELQEIKDRAAGSELDQAAVPDVVRNTFIKTDDPEELADLTDKHKKYVYDMFDEAQALQPNKPLTKSQKQYLMGLAAKRHYQYIKGTK